MAVNIFWHHMNKMNRSECDDNLYANSFMPFDKVEIDNLEGLKFILLLQLENRPEIGEKEMMESLESIKSQLSKISSQQMTDVLMILDKDGNNKISVEEITELTRKELCFVSDIVEYAMDDDACDGASSVNDHDADGEQGKINEVTKTEEL